MYIYTKPSIKGWDFFGDIGKVYTIDSVAAATPAARWPMSHPGVVMNSIAGMI